jgi:hypothetical protein
MSMGTTQRGARAMAMTYREVLKMLLKMPEEQLDRKAVFRFKTETVIDVGQEIINSLPTEETYKTMSELLGRDVRPKPKDGKVISLSGEKIEEV